MPLPPDIELGALLLARARQAIEHELGLGDAPGNDPRLAERGATFVTLRQAGELRGCIGSVRPQRPLAQDVSLNAVAAATHDTRFSPVTPDDLNDIRIEVSLLTEPQFLEFSDEDDLLRQLRPGVDGLMLYGGCRSATFLPQVWEQLPDPRMFLAALKQKAGISPDRPASTLMAARYTVRKWVE
jgi:AmmeMemoRadiSam system protein A